MQLLPRVERAILRAVDRFPRVMGPKDVIKYLQANPRFSFDRLEESELSSATIRDACARLLDKGRLKVSEELTLYVSRERPTGCYAGKGDCDCGEWHDAVVVLRTPTKINPEVVKSASETVDTLLRDRAKRQPLEEWVKSLTTDELEAVKRLWDTPK